jgi:linoleate 10R-lipoxygenase
MAAQLRCFAKLKGLRRAPGLEGQLKNKLVNGTFKVYMREDWSDWWPYPTTMKVVFDGFADDDFKVGEGKGEVVNGEN